MPDWLDEELPPDTADERNWPGDAAGVAAQAAADEAEQREIRARIVTAGIEHGFAHTSGAPPLPGIKSGPAGGFGQDEPYDLAAPDTSLTLRADYASGVGRTFAEVSDDELFGLLGARSRLGSRQSWELLTAVAELIRRRPAPGCVLRGPARMPGVWAEGTAGELALQLAVTRRAAEQLLSLAWDLQVKLPLTSQMLRDGVVDQDKAATIASYCANLTPEQAQRAERILFALDGVQGMTWGMIRDRIARAVIEVDPDAARKRREAAAKDRRIEIKPEESGNAMIAGRELPPVSVLVIDRKLTARAKQLRKLGVPGGMDELRVLAFRERWGEADPAGDLARSRGSDSNAAEDRPDDGQTDRNEHGGGGPEPGGPGGPDGTGGTGAGGGTGPAGGGCACGGAGSGTDGVAATIHLTAPVADLTENASRPGTLRGTGPIDPDLVRDLADSAARNDRTSYEFTLVGQDGRPAAHACGKPGPGDSTRAGNRPRPRSKPGKPRPSQSGQPELTLIERGPPGNYGTWRYTQHGREIIFEFEDLSGPCDHKHQASGHDPGRRLRHLTGVLNQACTHPSCRRPEAQCDYEHSKPYDHGGITCLCACGPVCRRDHQDKQRPGWKLEPADARGWFRWTTPSGRIYLSKPSVYPI